MGVSKGGALPACVSGLTNVGDVKREPVEEGVADQLGEEQAEGELHHSLRERTNTVKVAVGGEAQHSPLFAVGLLVTVLQFSNKMQYL